MKVTIQDIARQAGVSTATVDRVLNRRSGVKRTTAERVISVADALDYTPDPLAQALSRRSLLKFDFILPAGPNAFLNSLIGFIEEANSLFALQKVQTTAHLIDGFDPQSIAAAILEFKGKSDGLAVVAVDHPLVREAIHDLSLSGTPVVSLISDIAHSSRIGYVGVDNRMAGRTAGQLLGRFLGEARGEIGLIAGSMSYRGHEEREMGFRRILQEEYPDLKIVALAEGFDDSDTSYDRASHMLKEHPELVGLYSIGAGTQGIGQALIDTYRDKDVVFIGHELTAATRKFLVSGVMDVVIKQSGRQEIMNSVQMLLNYQSRQEMTANIEMPRIEIVVRENLS